LYCRATVPASRRWTHSSRVIVLRLRPTDAWLCSSRHQLHSRTCLIVSSPCMSAVLHFHLSRGCCHQQILNVNTVLMFAAPSHPRIPSGRLDQACSTSRESTHMGPWRGGPTWVPPTPTQTCSPLSLVMRVVETT
jgi:hypothetical protein